MSWCWPCELATKIILNSSQLFHLLSIWSGTLRAQYQKGVVTLWLYEKTPPEFLLAGKDEPILRAPYKAFLYKEIHNTKPGWFSWHLLPLVPTEPKQLYDGCVQPLMFTVRFMLMSAMMIIDVDVDVDIDVYVVAWIYIDWFWWYLCLIITQQCLGPLCLW